MIFGRWSSRLVYRLRADLFFTKLLLTSDLPTTPRANQVKIVDASCIQQANLKTNKRLRPAACKKKPISSEKSLRKWASGTVLKMQEALGEMDLLGHLKKQKRMDYHCQRLVTLMECLYHLLDKIFLII